MLGARRLAPVAAALVFVTTTGVACTRGSATSGAVIAQQTVVAGDGGVVHGDGAAITIPPGTLSRDGVITISRVAKDEFDFRVDVPWKGQVAISLPLKGSQDAILHNVGGTWVAEGTGPGQSTVWVTQLSVFSTLKNAAISALCVTWSVPKFLECLAEKLGKYVDKHLALWIAKKLDSSCLTNLIVSDAFGPEQVPLAIFSQACTEHAGETPPPSTPPATSPPPASPPSTSPPATSLPAQSSPQTSPPDTAPPATSPPATSPPPTTGAQTWTEQEGHRGAPTFSDYQNASGVGSTVPPGSWVQVTCKVYDPSIGSVSPDGYWYLIASTPWNNQYWAAANTFMNGDAWGCWDTSSCTHNTDYAVRDC